MTGMLMTETLHEKRDLAAIEDEWWALWRRMPAATPFQSPAWLIPWWTVFAPGVLRVVTARRGDRLVGLAPLYLESGRRGDHLLPIGISTSDYLDVLIDPDEAGDVPRALSRQIAAEHWDCWELHELRADAYGWRLAPPTACHLAEDRSSVCSVLELPAAAEETASAIPARKRRKLRMARHRADRCGGIRMVDAEGAGAPDLLSSLFGLHAARWAGRGGSEVLLNDEVASFHRAVIARMPADMIRLYGLCVGGDLVAAYYGLQDRGRAYAYMSGFDPGYGHVSPGTLMVGHAIEQAIRDGVREFDFLRGDEPFKRGWGAVQRHNGRRIFSRVADHVCA